LDSGAGRRGEKGGATWSYKGRVLPEEVEERRERDEFQVSKGEGECPPGKEPIFEEERGGRGKGRKMVIFADAYPKGTALLEGKKGGRGKCP